MSKSVGKRGRNSSESGSGNSCSDIVKKYAKMITEKSGEKVGKTVSDKVDAEKAEAGSDKFCSIVIDKDSNIYVPSNDGKNRKTIYKVPVYFLDEDMINIWNQAAMKVYTHSEEESSTNKSATNNSATNKSEITVETKLILGWKLGQKGMGWLKNYAQIIEA